MGDRSAEGLTLPFASILYLFFLLFFLAASCEYIIISKYKNFLNIEMIVAL